MFSSSLLPEAEALTASGGKVPKREKKLRTFKVRLLKLLFSCKFLVRVALFLLLAGLLFLSFETSKENNTVFKFFNDVFSSINSENPYHHKSVKKGNSENDNDEDDDDDDLSNVPRTGPILSQEALYLLAEQHSNVPITFYERYQKLPKKNFKRAFSSSSSKITYCPNVKLTTILALKHNNFYWQTVNVRLNGNGSFVEVHLLNAYLDDRGGPKRTVVRLLGASKYLKSIVGGGNTYSCLLWYEGDTAPVISKVTEVYNYHQADGAYGPIMFSCQVPELTELPERAISTGRPLPVTISLQTKPTCATVQQYPTNNLRIIAGKKSSKEEQAFHPTTSIGVCSRALRFEPFTDENFPVRLVEWLEAVRLLGADKVYLYIYHEVDEVPPLVEVLEEYEAEGFVELHRISLPGDQLNGMQIMHELLSHETPAMRKFHEKRIFFYQQMYELHDCLYRNLLRHTFIAQFDTDELIVPQSGLKEEMLRWPEMLQAVAKNLPKASLDRVTHFRNHMALVHAGMEVSKIVSADKDKEPVPWYLYTAKHIFRDQPKTAMAKSFYRTEKVVAYYPYSAFRCTNLPSGSGCPYHMIGENRSLLLHYQSEEESKQPSLVNKKYIPDRKSVWRLYQPLKAAVEQKLTKIFLMKKKKGTIKS